MLARDIRQKKVEVAPTVIRSIYRGVRGTEISREYRQSQTKDSTVTESTEKDKSLTYGEVVAESFLQILSSIVVQARWDASYSPVFYDLGSGTGRAVITAALSPIGFRKVTGIELVPGLHESATIAIEKLLKAIECIKTGEVGPADENKTKHDRRNKNGKIMDEGELAVAVASCLTKEPHGLPVDALCNELCKKIGHKVYKASIKPWGKFQKFMESQGDKFQFCDDGSVKLRSLSGESGEGEVETKGSGTKDIDNICESSSAAVVEDSSTAALSTIASVRSTLESTNAIDVICPLPQTEFIEGDIFVSVRWWDDADIVYAASLLFSNDMMTRLTNLARQMRPGTWFISLKPLILDATVDVEGSQGLQLRSESFYRMSWQMAKVYIYEKI
jgi:SAM-dependent methyltransferase